MSRTKPPCSHHPTSTKVSNRDTRIHQGEVLVMKGDDNCFKLEANASAKKKKSFQGPCRMPNRRSRPTLHVCWDFGNETLKCRGPQDLAMLNAVNDIVAILQGLDPEGENPLLEVSRASTDLDSSRANSSRSTSCDNTDNQNLNSSLEPEEAKFSAESKENLFGAVPLSREKLRDIRKKRTARNASRANLSEWERSSSLDYGDEELLSADTDETSLTNFPRQSHTNLRSKYEYPEKRTPHLSSEFIKEEHQMRTPGRELKSGARKLGQKKKFNKSSSDSDLQAETHSLELHDQLGVRNGRRQRSEQEDSGSQEQSMAKTRQPRQRADANVPAVEKALNGPAWRSRNQRIRMKTLVTQFRYLHKLYETQNKERLGVRPDTMASNYMKSRGYTMHKGFTEVGAIAGLEVGDSFHFREELHLLGVHRAVQSGIDYLTADKSGYTDKDGKPVAIAVSVVSSGGYKDNGGDEDGEYLVYSGAGGANNLSRMRTPSSKVGPDQQMVRGNLAMKNSCDLRIPIRVICGLKVEGGKGSRDKIYCYAGLYSVRNYYTDTGLAGTKDWKFTLVRLDNQPPVPTQLTA